MGFPWIPPLTDRRGFAEALQRFFCNSCISATPSFQPPALSRCQHIDITGMFLLPRRYPLWHASCCPRLNKELL